MQQLVSNWVPLVDRALRASINPIKEIETDLPGHLDKKLYIQGTIDVDNYYWTVRSSCSLVQFESLVVAASVGVEF
jgi:hypothetical protein